MNSKLYFREARRAAHRYWTANKEHHREKPRLRFTPIKTVDVSVRLQNAARQMGVSYFEQLEGIGNEIYGLRNVGRITVRELVENLNRLGIPHKLKIREW